MYVGGVVISSHGPPKTRGQSPVHRAQRQRSAAAPAIEEDLANLDVDDDDVLSEEEGGGGRPKSCITSSITEAEVHSRFEEIRSYLYAKGRGGEYSKIQYLLSKAVHSFTHETQVKRRGKERGEVQASLRDLSKG